MEILSPADFESPARSPLRRLWQHLTDPGHASVQAHSLRLRRRTVVLAGLLYALLAISVVWLPQTVRTPALALATLPLPILVSICLRWRWIVALNGLIVVAAVCAGVLLRAQFPAGTTDAQAALALLLYASVCCSVSFAVGVLAHERRRMSTELRRSRERFQSLTAFSGDWMWEQDQELRFTYFSAAVRGKPGIDFSAAIGKTRSELPYEWESEAAKRQHAEDLAARRPFRDLRLTLPLKTGGPRYLSVSREPVFAQDGSFRGYRGGVNDVTAAAQAAIATRESEARFRGLVELSNDWYWETDAALHFSFLSEGFEQASGFAAEDLLGKSSLELKDVWLSQEQRAEHHCALTGRLPFRDLIRRRATQAGDWRYAAVSGEPVFDRSGAFCGYRGVGRDITAQCLAERAVREASERFRDLVEVSNDWYWEQDETLRFTRIHTSSAVHLLDLPSLIGTYRWDHPFTNMSAADWDAHRELLRVRSSFRDLELIGRDDADKPFHLLVSGRPIFDADGTFRGYRGTTRNATQARRAEQRAQRLSASYATLSEANEAIIHCHDEATLFEQLCRIVAAHSRLIYCRISRIDPATQEVETAAQAGDPNTGLGNLRVSMDANVPEGKGPASEALRTGKPVVVNTVSTDPRIAHWQQTLRASSVRALAIFPLHRGNVVIGGLHLYADQADFFDEDLLALLDRLTLNLCFALVNLERQAARLQAETALRLSETRFRDFTEAAAEYVWETTAGSRITFISGRAEHVSGYRADQLIGRTPNEFMIPGEAERVRAWLQTHRKDDGSFSELEYQVVSRSGEVRWIRLNGVPILNDNGERVGWRGTGADVTDRRAATERIAFLAMRDPLTELPNRVLLSDRLSKAMADGRRAGKAVAVMFVDLDRFKAINDSLGHEVGDLVLKSTTQRVLSCIREGDTLARMGGDEFVVVLKDLRHAEDARHVAAKILLALSQPFEVGGHSLSTSSSIGISIYPDDALDEHSLMRNADVAMYHAKACGRGNCQFYAPDMNTRATERLALETAMRLALERGEFLLHYQPQVDVQTAVASSASRR